MEEIPLVSPETVRNREKERIFHRRINTCWKAFKDVRLKPERIIHCDAKILFQMCTDVHVATMRQWDADCVEYERIEELDDNMWSLDDGKALMWFREGHHGERTTWTIIHALDESYVAYQIMVLDQGRCYISTNTSRERLDVIASHVDGDIYKDWPCIYCHKQSPAHMLVCISCHQARYWKCECGVAQLFGAANCRKCGTMLLQ